MKLLFCRKCHDARRMNPTFAVLCDCGAVKGQYLPDGLRAIVAGREAEVIGLDWRSLAYALRLRPAKWEKELGPELYCFLFPKNAERIERVEWNDSRFTKKLNLQENDQ